MTTTFVQKRKISLPEIFKKHWISLAVPAVILLYFISNALISNALLDVHQSRKKGDSAYDKKQFSEAEEQYRKALEKMPTDPDNQFNAGNSIYEQGRYEQAGGFFEPSAETFKTPAAKADALHNLGNAFFKKEKYDRAIQAYLNSLRLRPGDPETKKNLQIAREKLIRQQEEQKKKEEEEQKKKEEKQNEEQAKDGEQQNPQSGSGQQKSGKPQEGQEQLGRMSKEEAKRLLESAIEPKDRENSKKYRTLGAGKKPKTKPEQDW